VDSRRRAKAANAPIANTMSPRKTYALRQPDCAMSAELQRRKQRCAKTAHGQHESQCPKPRRLSNQPDTIWAYGSGVKAKPQAYATTSRNANSPGVCAKLTQQEHADREQYRRQERDASGTVSIDGPTDQGQREGNQEVCRQAGSPRSCPWSILCRR